MLFEGGFGAAFVDRGKINNLPQAAGTVFDEECLSFRIKLHVFRQCNVRLGASGKQPVETGMGNDSAFLGIGEPVKEKVCFCFFNYFFFSCRVNHHRRQHELCIRSKLF